MLQELIRPLTGGMLLSMLAACGGGGGGTVSSPPPVLGPAPTPAPTPTPTPSPATSPVPVTIFTNPVPQTYASVGVFTDQAGNGYDGIPQDSRLTSAVFDASHQPEIRYTSGGTYELRLPGGSFDRLMHYKGLLNPPANNNFFQQASTPQNDGTFITRRSSDANFQHSELASWSTLAGTVGYLAFGTLTPAGSVPQSGSATYQGPVAGLTDITYSDALYGGYFFLPADGSVTVNVDFETGTIGGFLALSIPDGMNPREIGNFAFAPMTLSSGKTGFGGSFATQVSGMNHFAGMFTGPGGKEMIGTWALPFMFEGQAHQAIGAYIAQRP